MGDGCGQFPTLQKEIPPMRLTWILTLLALLCLVAVPAVAADKDAEPSIKVEIRGTLATGIVAIGGETTGTTITVKNVTWELDLGGDKDLIAMADKLNKKMALVTGTYEKKKGLEVPERHIVKVTSIKAAEK
jgi:hypothetical protein